MITVQKGMPDFQWITKSKSYNRGYDDVSLSYYLTKDHRLRGRIILRNGVSEKISKTGYVMFGIDGENLYFCETDSRNGYKLSATPNSHIKNVGMTESTLCEFIKNHIGDYRLDKDSKSGLWYINCERG